ncbi:hypothetical protein KP509_33G062900 [Ceratopteris richardii]|uniref:B30.2/SPRY domain-containing protein n=1 Tax=Ceratopteris richardii TaxID=49495 RepID=A0A8T2QRJ2_CERRI|nr:hypothetical protein KP509_33G062900 [Ceratopteris richardii]
MHFRIPICKDLFWSRMLSPSIFEAMFNFISNMQESTAVPRVSEAAGFVNRTSRQSTVGSQDGCETEGNSRNTCMRGESALCTDTPFCNLSAHFEGASSARLGDSCLQAQLESMGPCYLGDVSFTAQYEKSFQKQNAPRETSPDGVNKEKHTTSLTFPNIDVDQKRKQCNISEKDQDLSVGKKPRKKTVNIWAKSSSRKGGKKNSKNCSQSASRNAVFQTAAKEDYVCITYANRHQEKIEDGPHLPVVLSKYHKAEKIELSDDRLSACNAKGYRMVRATRGVVEGAWYFEIVVKMLGPSGHTRLGWSTQEGEIEAPVGFDNHSFAYRDLDGSKVHVALREPYGDPYAEGDVIGFYINLPNGAEFAPKPATVVSYRGHPYILEERKDPPKAVPGSEITFFKNGTCQGTAFKDLYAGRYFPAASMYTLPHDPKCIVKFHFGPDFMFPPVDIGNRPTPQPLAHAPHCGKDAFGLGCSLLSEYNATRTHQAEIVGKPRSSS